MSDSTIELSVFSEGASQDELVAVLSGAGFEGFWEDGDVLRAYIKHTRWSDAAMASTQESLAAYAGAKGIRKPRIEIRTILAQNWNAQWEESIQPVQVTPGIIIAPSWHPVTAKTGQIVLTIDPKMSFGTGHHETTRLVLEMMEHRIEKGCTMLDVGTGTGILAITAVKLGARIAVGVDIDEWSYENANENAAANGVSQQLRIYRGELADVPAGSFDIVAANIQRNVLEEMLGALSARANPDGWLFLSGILTSELPGMRTTIAYAGLRVEEERTAEEWAAFAIRHAH
ncbi:MAG: 50S ribosomal protein L11 methyltransferase [Bacteroidota bacterium]